jgi:hypothetical protein
MADSSERARRQAIEAELISLSHAFAYGMDYHQYDELVELFTPDALLDRVLEVHHGRQEISEGVRARTRAMAIRHVSTNFHFTHIDAETVRGVVYNISHFAPVDDGRLPAVYGSTHGMLLDFHDLYKLTPDGWKFAERVARPVMLPAGSPMFRPEVEWRQRDVL